MLHHPRVTTRPEELSSAFVQLPLELLHDRTLNPTAKVVLAQLLWISFRRLGFPGQAALADELGISLRTVERAISDLKRAHWLTLVQRPGMTATIIIPSPARELPLLLPQRPGERVHVEQLK
jgi:hypothetical protein